MIQFIIEDDQDKLEFTQELEEIMQKAVAVRDGDDAKTLQRRVMEQAEWIILPESTEKVCAELVKSKN